MACVFCGAAKTTREQAWPDGVREEFERPKLLAQRARGTSIEDRAFAAPPFTAIVSRVCANCNNGWMSDLETQPSRCSRRSSKVAGAQSTRRVKARSPPGLSRRQ
jgi:hypothetical protein